MLGSGGLQSQSSHSSLIFAQINLMASFDVINEIVEKDLIKVLATQGRVSTCR